MRVRVCGVSLQANNGPCDGDERPFAFVGFEAAHCASSEILAFSKEVLDHILPFVGLAVEFCWDAAVGFRRDDARGLGSSQHLAE